MSSTRKRCKKASPVISKEPPFWMTKPFRSRNQQLYLQKAYRFGYRAHAHEIRKDDHPYYTHPKAVARIIIEEWQVYDLRAVIDALFHDMRERKTNGGFPVTRAILLQEFDEEIEQDNYALTRKGSDKKKKEPKARYMGRIIFRGWRTLLVKFADRVHNLRTLQFQPREKWERIYRESVEFYLPLIDTLEVLLPNNLKSVTERVQQSLERALNHADRLIRHNIP